MLTLLCPYIKHFYDHMPIFTYYLVKRFILAILLSSSLLLLAKSPTPSPNLQAYIINLDRSKDRYAYVEKPVSELGFSLKRFSAIDGRTLTAPQIEKILDPAFFNYTGTFADLGTIGCSLSHIGAWQDFVKSDYDYALIFEDDVSFNPKVLREVVLSLLAKPASWDLVNFQVGHRGFAVMTRTLPKGHHMAQYLTKITNAGGYLLKRSTAIKLLKKSLPIKMPIDHYFLRSWEHGFKVSGVEPRLVFQTHGTSDINKPVMFMASKGGIRPSFWQFICHEIYKLQTYAFWFIDNFQHYIIDLWVTVWL